MNTRNLHGSTKHTAYTARYPFSIRHTISQSKVVLQYQYRDRYNELVNTSNSHKNNNLTSKPTPFHRKLMLSQ